jgi:large subunit ribosomal protein L17
MRHLKAGRKLNRNASHRLAMKRNLAMALFRHERIITTVAKAKEVRPFVEKLITLAKRNTLHARRLVAARLGSPANAEVKPGAGDDADHRRILTKVFDEIAPRFAARPGGYTRIIKRSERRLGDAGQTAFLELVKEGEEKRVRTRPAPAPRVEHEEEESSAPEQEQAPAAPAPTPEASASQPTPPASSEAQAPPSGPTGTPPENPPKT